MLDTDDISAITWDAVISGTGLREALIAAALSRAGKQVLHIDRNNHYGACHAAFSLDEARAWVKSVNADVAPYVPFHSAACSDLSEPAEVKLGSSRQYSISISPEVVHLVSPILPLLVNNSLHESMEFVKVGSWHVWTTSESEICGSVKKVPNGREDVFKDRSMDLKTKRSTVRFLKGIMEAASVSTEDHATGNHRIMFQEFLTSPPNSLPLSVVPFLASLTSSYLQLDKLPSKVGVASIRRHLESTGRLGSGYSAVIARYGTGSEIIQTFCRSAAVAGGAVYVLGEDLKSVSGLSKDNSVFANLRTRAGVEDSEEVNLSCSDYDGKEEFSDAKLQVVLENGKVIKTRFLISDHYNMSSAFVLLKDSPSSKVDANILRAAFVIGHPLSRLFETSESPLAASAVIYVPEGAVIKNSASPLSQAIHILVNNHESGDCARGQCIMYTTSELVGDLTTSFETLTNAVKQIAKSLTEEDNTTADVLFWLRYIQPIWAAGSPSLEVDFVLPDVAVMEHILLLPFPPVELTLSDSVIQIAQDIFQKVTGTWDGFMESNITNNEEMDENKSEDVQNLP